jgi:hypothetical protein
MSQRKRLVPSGELVSLLNTLRDFGLDIQCVDVRSDGISVSSLPSIPAVLASAPSKRDAFDDWKAQDN